MSDAATIPAAGERFGRFTLLERVGKGGMAEVFRATTSRAAGVAKEVCIKRILPPLMGDERMRDLFIQEARIAASLTHANIIPVYEFGIIDDYHFLAMEYVDGVTIRDLMMACAGQKRWPAIPEIIHLGTEVLEGLDYAHRKRDSSGQALDIVHRDVTPGNVMISRAGEVKILDFGIGQMGVDAKARAGREGKPGYMAPEQLVGMAADRRVDIYALGVVLHEMLARRRLFKVKGGADRLAKANRIAPPSRFNEQVSAGIDHIVMRALAPEADARFASAGEMRDALLDVMHAEGLRAGRSHMAGLVAGLFGTKETPVADAYQSDVLLVDEQSLERQPRRQRITRSHRATITGGHVGLASSIKDARSKRLKFMLVGAALGIAAVVAFYFAFLYR